MSAVARPVDLAIEARRPRGTMNEDRFWGLSALAIGIVLVVGLGVTMAVSASNRDDDDVATEQAAVVDEGLLVLAIAIELNDEQTAAGGSTTSGTTTSGTTTATTTTGTTATGQLTSADISRLQEQQRQRAEARSAYLAQLRQAAQAGAAAASAEAQARGCRRPAGGPGRP